MPDFVHLHTHSDFSLLDGAASIGELVERTRALNIKHCALTDHGNMFGAVQFYKECKKNKINPIIGSEFYIAPDSRHSKTAGDGKPKYNHLVLLASSEVGYRNLIKLSSAGYVEGFYYRPRIDDDILKEHSRDIIALSACLAGEIPSLVLAGRDEDAEKKALFYADMFGRDRFYLEIQDHGIPEQKTVNMALIDISRRTNIPVVATNDIHYMRRDDAKAQDVLICIGTNKKLSESDRMRFKSDQFYYKSPEEMEALFGSYPAALTNTLKIAEMCNLTISLPGPRLPDYHIPGGYTLRSYFTEIAYRGLAGRYGEITPQIKERFDYEITVIDSMNFIGYFLIVWDFIRFAKENGIPVGPGRGSGAGSIVAYSLNITDIDPLQYGLLFERFLNPDRVSMPDFDIDFCYERRGEVIDYVTTKYGEARVGQIITFGTLKPKAVIRDVARVLDFPYDEADRIAKLVPGGPKITLEKAISMEQQLKDLEKNGEKYSELLEISKKLEGRRRHASTHAAGIVIGKSDLTDYVPLYRDPRTGSISTQYTMEYLEECGLVKMDFLGLKTLTLIEHTLSLLEKRGVHMVRSEIPLEDTNTFALLGEGKSTCIFQFESQGMQNILKKARPEKIEDLIALNALYRPGPMDHIDQYIESRLNPRKITYPLPELEPVLKETYGVIVYQEQVMEIARIVAGFSLGQADILRRAMGKKKEKVMEEMREKFVAGAREKGYTQHVADDIFKLLIPFAGYGFNKSHAAAYSVLAYQTAYLKANYPAEFMAANLTNEINNPDKLAEYIHETREMGIDILRPDINLSEKTFTVLDGHIIYGLMGVKNVGTAAVDVILHERSAGGDYSDIIDFLERVDLKVVNRKVTETLIYCGLFDNLGENRATLFGNLDKLLDCAHKKQEMKMYGQASLFDGLKEDGFEEVAIERQPEYPQKQLLDWEKQFLGLFFSGHPLDKYRRIISRYTTLNLDAADGASKDKTYSVIGILKNVKEIITKTGKKMAFGLIEDFNGSIELVIFSDVFEKYRMMLENDRVIAVEGKIDLSRGEPKLIVAAFYDVSELPEQESPAEPEATSVHILLSGNVYNTELLHRLCRLCEQSSGSCTLYIHPDSRTNGGSEFIKAGPQLKVKADKDFFDKLLEYPQVIKVWKE
ncbi:MAG: DNA polymerase III subunit alpha [Spirochaetales bacterium]|nr:DNA polymerase III subunit alpha [Spirochaetales bacterium]